MPRQYGGLDRSGYETVFRSLGVERKPIARAWAALLPLVRWKDGVPTIQISIKDLAKRAFNGNTSTASKAIKNLIEAGALDVLQGETSTKSRVYRVVLPKYESDNPKGCNEHVASDNPKGCKNEAVGLSKSPFGVVPSEYERDNQPLNTPLNTPGKNGGSVSSGRNAETKTAGYVIAECRDCELSFKAFRHADGSYTQTCPQCGRTIHGRRIGNE